MKSFVVCVTVGEFSGQGEGKSKKIAKKLAAAAALAELRQLPHIPSVEKTLPRIKKKTKSIIKVPPHPPRHGRAGQERAPGFSFPRLCAAGSSRRAQSTARG